MNSIDKITTEIAPTSLDVPKVTVNLDIKSIMNQFEELLPREKADNFIVGKTAQGLKKSSSSQLLRLFLYKEIDNTSFVRGDDTDSRITNEKMKKALRLQVDNIINIVELSLTSQDNQCYMLGMLLKNISNTL